MPLTCPACDRTLADSGDPADPPRYCMYCGGRLGDSVGSAPVKPFGPAAAAAGPDTTVDLGTQAYVPSPDTHAPPHAPPTRVGGYELVRFIGAGGMGAVYEGVADDTGQRVAVKLLSPRLAASAGSVERFRQEGRVASQIAHPRCVFVLRADADAGRPYIVMELMPGKTLKDVVDARGPLPPHEAVARILDVIDGLAEAHRLGVIHRDVKPGNCFLTPDDRVKVGDFGLSKSLATDAADPQLTGSGTFLGTVLFASPEQIRGEPVGYESDVYGVCATLYFLLTGRAPHQHESVTAAVARVISEPVRPMRAVRPKLPVELDRVVLRGLERDRDRRWQTLDDLRDALAALLPAGHRPARPRALALAYSADVLLLQPPLLAVEVLVRAAVGSPVNIPGAVGLNEFALAVVYFGVLDGLLGGSVGKRLIGLRVTRPGQTGPPGLRAGVLRAAAFHAVLFSTLIGLGWLLGPPGGGPGKRLAGAVAAAAGLAALATQFRRTESGFRGVHDLAAGTHTVQRPRPPVRTRLVSRFPAPLDRPRAAAGSLPADVGGFTVRGKLADLPDGGEVWAAEDRSLGRRVLVRLLPARAAGPPRTPPAGRPTRLRAVGQGAVERAGRPREWVAYVAPAGVPLADVVDPRRPLAWADARPLLEQLLDELIAGDADGTGVHRPAVAQVWVEPAGRLQLLDFPLPTGAELSGSPDSLGPDPGTSEPLRFVRQVATLALEGRPRAAGGPVRAPVPPYAAGITGRLFRDDADGYLSLSALRKDLADTHAHPAQVTPGMRAAHLGVQGFLLTGGLLAMFLAAGLYTFGLAVVAAAQVWGPDAVTVVAADPAKRAAALAAAGRLPPHSPTREDVEAAFAPRAAPRTVRALEGWIGPRQMNLEAQYARLTRPERLMLDRLSEAVTADPPDPGSRQFLESAAFYVRAATAPAPEPPADPRGRLAAAVAVVLAGFPVGWAAVGWLFRGGPSLAFAGLTLVRADGRRPGRWRCGLRELVVWAPVSALLLACVWAQTALPDAVLLRAATWLLAAALLPLYVVLAMRTPDHGPHDRLLGLYLVPV